MVLETPKVPPIIPKGIWKTSSSIHLPRNSTRTLVHVHRFKIYGRHHRPPRNFTKILYTLIHVRKFKIYLKFTSTI